MSEVTAGVPESNLRTQPFQDEEHGHCGSCGCRGTGAQGWEVNIPDYISPVVRYRVWQWNAARLKSLNGEPWLPGRPLAAGCRAAVRGTIVGHAKAVHGAHELPHSDCTCGVYAAKSLEHLRQFGYERRGIHGEVYLWGTVVEHRLGWRGQFECRLLLCPGFCPEASLIKASD